MLESYLKKKQYSDKTDWLSFNQHRKSINLFESMEEAKQSLQKKQENYKAVYLQKRIICNRQSVYISGEIQKRIMQIVGVITGKQVSIGNFIDNVLEEHLNTHNDVLSALYREEMQKGIFNQPKEKNL